MPILGAIIGGGGSTRFGRDKAVELLEGQALIDHVRMALAKQVDEIVICGRDWLGLRGLHDRPEADLGPLGGINAALHYGAAHGFDGILCMPVDVHPAPENIADTLFGPEISVLNEQHLIGYWPVNLADAVDAYLMGGGRKVGRLLDQLSARRVDDPAGLTNVNHPDDLEKLKLA